MNILLHKGLTRDPRLIYWALKTTDKTITYGTRQSLRSQWSREHALSTTGVFEHPVFGRMRQHAEVVLSWFRCLPSRPRTATNRTTRRTRQPRTSDGRRTSTTRQWQEHARYYMACAFQGIQHLHELRVMLRSLKPEDCALDERGDTARVGEVRGVRGDVVSRWAWQVHEMGLSSGWCQTLRC